jgi:hypothetical protein
MVLFLILEISKETFCGTFEGSRVSRCSAPPVERKLSTALSVVPPSQNRSGLHSPEAAKSASYWLTPERTFFGRLLWGAVGKEDIQNICGDFRNLRN